MGKDIHYAIIGITILLTLLIIALAFYTAPPKEFFALLFQPGKVDSVEGTINQESITITGDTNTINFTITYENLVPSSNYKYQFNIYFPPYYIIDPYSITDWRCFLYLEDYKIQCGGESSYTRIWYVSEFSVSFAANRNNLDSDAIEAIEEGEVWNTIATELGDESTKEIDFLIGIIKPSAVVSNYPTGGAVNINSSIVVGFSKPMDSQSVQEAFSIYPYVGGSFSWNQSGDKLTFIPFDNLDTNTTYAVTISTDAADLHGNNLQSDYSWSFTTVAPPPDNNPPIVTLLNQADGSSLVVGEIVFEYMVIDEESGIESCSLILDGSVDQTHASVQEGTSQYFTKNIQVEGTRTWDVTCNDNSAQQNEGEGAVVDWNFTITVDATPPELVEYGPTGIIDNPKPTIWAVIKDDESGINLATVKLKIDTTTTVDHPDKNTLDAFDDVNVYTIPANNLENGTHYAAIYFANNAGKEYCIDPPSCTNAGWFYWDFTIQTGTPSENQVPETTLTADNTTGIAPLTVNFLFSCWDSDGTISSCLVDFGDGSEPVELGFGESIISGPISYTYSNAGTFTATLNATDNNGATDLTPAYVSINVSPAVPPPTEFSVSLSVSPTRGYAPLTVQFDASASGGVPPYIYEWDFEGTGDFGIGGSSEAYIYYYEGEYPAKVRVGDLEGNTAVDSVAIIVEERPNEPPKITNLTAEPLLANEGTAVTFTVYAYDPDGNYLTYRWDFGDGEIIEIGKSFITHSYYLEPAEPERDFTATVEVSDGALTDSDSIVVKVEKAYFVIKLLEPLSTPTNLLDKDEEITIRLKIIDATNNPLTGLSPNASIQDIGIALSESTRGNYTGRFKPSYFTKSIDYLFVEAWAYVAGEMRYTNSEFPLYFAPAEIKLSNPFEEKEYYVGDTIGKVELGLTYLDYSPVEDAEIKAFFLYDEKRKEISFTRKASGIFVGDINYLIREKERLSLEVEAEDEFGNKTPAKKFTIPIGLENPLFNISLVNPNFALANIFGYGQPIDFLVTAESEQKNDLGDVEVELQNDELNLSEKFGFDSATGNYSLKYYLPEKEEYPKNTIAFKIVATGSIDEKKYFDWEKIYLVLTDQTDLNFIYPTDGTGFINLDEPNKIIVRITYPNGDLIDKNELEAVFIDNDRNSSIKLVKTERGFEANLGYDLRAGEHTFELRLEEERYKGQTKRVVAVLVNPIDISQILIFILGLFIVFLIIYFGHSKFKEKAKIKKELEIERTNLIGLTKSLRYEYYKRHISEQEYKKRLLEAHQKLAAVEEMLGVKERMAKVKITKVQKEKLRSQIKRGIREKLKGLGKPTGKKEEKPLLPKEEEKIEKKPGEKSSIKDYFKGVMDKVVRKPIDEELKKQFSEAEKEDIKRLVFLLRNQKGKYSREELFKAMIADGYPPKIAEKVVAVLFRK